MRGGNSRPSPQQRRPRTARADAIAPAHQARNPLPDSHPTVRLASVALEPRQTDRKQPETTDLVRQSCASPIQQQAVSTDPTGQEIALGSHI